MKTKNYTGINGKDILVDMTLEQAYCVVAAIISYARKELR